MTRDRRYSLGRASTVAVHRRALLQGSRAGRLLLKRRRRHASCRRRQLWLPNWAKDATLRIERWTKRRRRALSQRWPGNGDSHARMSSFVRTRGYAVLVEQPRSTHSPPPLNNREAWLFVVLTTTPPQLACFLVRIRES